MNVTVDEVHEVARVDAIVKSSAPHHNRRREAISRAIGVQILNSKGIEH